MKKISTKLTLGLVGVLVAGSLLTGCGNHRRYFNDEYGNTLYEDSSGNLVYLYDDCDSYDRYDDDYYYYKDGIKKPRKISKSKVKMKNLKPLEDKNKLKKAESKTNKLKSHIKKTAPKVKSVTKSSNTSKTKSKSKVDLTKKKSPKKTKINKTKKPPKIKKTKTKTSGSRRKKR